jgi:hypothetical protein
MQRRMTMTEPDRTAQPVDQRRADRDTRPRWSGVPALPARISTIRAMGAAGVLVAAGNHAVARALSRTTPATIPIQRLPLDPTRLNVAGEHHDESDYQREYEIQYAAEVAEGKYYEENELEITDIANFDSGAHFFTQRGGDPVGLRMLFMVGMLLDSARAAAVGPAFKDRAELPLDFAEQERTHTSLGFEVETFRRRLNANLEMKWDPPDWKLASEAVAKFASANAEAVEALAVLRQGVELRTNIGLTQVKWGQYYEYLKSMYRYAAEGAGVQVAEGEFSTPASLWNDVGRQRSSEMDMAAETATSQPQLPVRGLWKVGDAHVDHIKEDSTWPQRPYNLLSREDFNDGLRDWLRRQPWWTDASARRGQSVGSDPIDFSEMSE